MARSGHWPRETATPFHVLQQELHRLLDQYIGPVRFGGRSGEPATDLEPSAWTPRWTSTRHRRNCWSSWKCPASIPPRSTWLAPERAEPQGHERYRRTAGTEDPGPRARSSAHSTGRSPSPTRSISTGPRPPSTSACSKSASRSGPRPRPGRYRCGQLDWLQSDFVRTPPSNDPCDSEGSSARGTWNCGKVIW